MLGALTDVGNVRQINEDYYSFYEDESVRIYLVADGMGGHNAGEIASALAAEKVIEYVIEHKNEEKPKDLLRNSVLYANKVIYERALENNNLKGMGTTITAYLCNGEGGIVANVGDSSCYIIKAGGILKVTKDHSLVQQLIDEGSITEQEAKLHPNKNIITRALGTGIDVDIDIFDISIKDLHKIILCTDGLTNEVLPEEIYEYIKKYSNNVEACRELINIAKERGGRDNITVMVIEGGV
ncbi:Stp1/IreP family PP2C-type Ser/Thr phosphatase [Clostridium thermarum]|uniref:Stp1/IreP family PP2C-type Ser/Thr phosphatase n=1 Tax=Clostridium thermarum TaxID=1716543 RepID=UPI00111FBB2D|nr:Stp1/IreP family PP2C-type Ser/Thr phosphatase [Clostridium thermarum]